MTDLRSQLQSALGDAYAIERELGGGGMSRVFVATERALNRQVVIKVLPGETAGAVSIERFKREIAVAARLQQANIVPVLTAGEAGGVPFFTMPFVEGESLRARLAKGGELPIPDAIGILKEVARALAYAHGQGVVHRDIKPDNVLLSGGTAMVTDFGVAKALSAATTADGSALTATGLAIGTPAYMAPEQASGDPHIDHRADIYAFGCLAYELFTGTAPFAGRTPQQSIAAHLTESPDPVERRRSAVPWQVAALIARCLAKNPADRPQQASELIATLDQATFTPQESPSRPTAAPRTRAPMLFALGTLILVAGGLLLWPLWRPPRSSAMSVAVLPFANSTGDTTNAFLAEGLSDELRIMLASVSGLSVKARGSSIAFATKGAREVGAALDVAAVLQGTLTRTAGQPKVVAELVSARDETVLWTGSLDLATTASASARESLVRSIATALHATLGAGGVTAAMPSRGTDSDSAYAAFLRGEYHRRRFAIDLAVPDLLRATQLDPGFARAHESLATAYATLPILGIAVSSDLLPKAKASIARALELQPGSSAARFAKGMILVFSEFKYAEGEAALREAAELDPQNSEKIMWHAWALGSLGRMAEAETAITQAGRLDPQATDIMVFQQALALASGRWGEGIERTKQILAIDSTNGPALWNLSEAYAFTSKPDSAVMALERMLRVDSEGLGAHAIATLTYAAAGRWSDARAQRVLGERNPGNSPNYIRALNSVAFGEIEVATDYLTRAVHAHEPLANSIWLPCEPYLSPLHDRPGFQSLMHELGATPCTVALKWPIGPPKP